MGQRWTGDGGRGGGRGTGDGDGGRDAPLLPRPGLGLAERQLVDEAGFLDGDVDGRRPAGRERHRSKGVETERTARIY